MLIFKQNIYNMYGSAGEVWLNNLPELVKQLCSEWKLSGVTAVPNLTYNYVIKAILGNKPVILKLSYDGKELENEFRALNYFSGHGAVRVLRYSKKYNAILLEHLMPGNSLKQNYPVYINKVMDCYINTMQKLHSQTKIVNQIFPTIEAWLEAIEKLSSTQLPVTLLNHAIDLKNKLLASKTKCIVLHGDLHLDNILKNNNDWLAIDPKGVIGAPLFEAAAFDFVSSSEINSVNLSQIFEERINLFAEKAQINSTSLKEWIFLRLILSIAWSVEDKTDFTNTLRLANSLFQLIRN